MRETSLPWCLGGDFNAVLWDHERTGLSNKREMEHFRQFVDDGSHIDLPLSGNKFTWCNNKEKVSFSRLNRFLMDVDMLGRFPTLRQHNKPKVSWDCPPNGWFKFNIDRAARDCLGHLSIGRVLRDDFGAVKLVFYKKAGWGDANLAEVLAVREAMILFAASSWVNSTSIIIESDSSKKELKFGWQIVVGTVIGFFGAAFGSVGGVGGGGIFVPMLTLIIGFDKKSSTAISKCMIMGAPASTVYYKLRQRHPRLDMPMIDYDLVLIIQPMLLLGISIGVTFNVIFPDWTVTILLILLCTGTSVKAYFKGVETRKRETVLKQVPVSVGINLYEANGLCKGWKVIASKGDEGTNWKGYQLVLCCACGMVAGIVGGLLGIGGGFAMGRLFLELGIPPPVTSATATFGMTCSSSMSVVEYYPLNRFPVPYALYFIVVSVIAALIGQHTVDKLIRLTGREPIIIFVLPFTIFVSAISLGGVGISGTIEKIEQNAYMGFENLCKYEG
ncbi:Membrane protein-like, putative [Theobroma cacao]|uniref:Membrane protein-like, putative n=1 Tax=Theobroma cacao TaxID=3641 RepID=A0A061GIK9_THECC|nr:Membrane protein-like, putative [Theobroma cacao]